MCARRAEDSFLPKQAAIEKHVSALPLLELFDNVLFYFTQVPLASRFHQKKILQCCKS
jgi:hypothetical protein